MTTLKIEEFTQDEKLQKIVYDFYIKMCEQVEAQGKEGNKEEGANKPEEGSYPSEESTKMTVKMNPFLKMGADRMAMPE